jgi:hypothetical protein
MSIPLHNSFAIASLALAVVVTSMAGAKPPDLPSASRETVAPPIEQIPVMPKESKAASQPAKVDIDARLSGARRLYLIGERCRRTGDLDMAVNCYHEVKLLSPHSAYARKARRRLHEIDVQRTAHPAAGDAEEQEVPRPMPQHHKITIELEPPQSPPMTGHAQPPTPSKTPVLRVPLPPRNLTIYVEEPERY